MNAYQWLCGRLSVSRSLLALASSIMLVQPVAHAQELIYREDFNTDGDGTRFTTRGRGFVLDSGAGGSAYWAPNLQVNSSGGEVSIALRTLGKRAILAWHHTIPAEEVKPQMRTLLGATIDWLAQGRTSKTVLFSPNSTGGTGDTYIADLLVEKGFTVQDDDTSVDPPAPANIAFVVQSSSAAPPVPTRFLRYAAPLLTYNGPNHDDEGTSSIGDAAQLFQPTNAVIVTSSHPAAGGLTGPIDIIGSAQTFDTVGSRLPAEATVVASFKRPTPFVLDSTSKVDDLIAGTLASTKTEGSLEVADVAEDASSTGDWAHDLVPPGINGDDPPSYALVGRGKLTVTTPGTYTFALGVDDGGRLRIDLNKNGVGPEDTQINLDGASAFRRALKDVTFASAGTYDFEWLAFDQSGSSGAELSVATQAGSTPEPVAAGAWELLGEHAAGSPVKLAGPITVTTYVPNVPEVLADSTLLAVLDLDQRLLGDALNGWEGAGFWAGADMNEPLIADCCSTVDEPREVTLNPVNVAGKTDLKLTIALAAADIDFEDSDFLRLSVDPDGSGPQDFVILDTFTAKDASEKFFRNLNGDGPRRLGYTFQDFTYDLPAGSSQLVLRIQAMSTFFNEMLGFDNIRITSGSSSGGATISISRSGADLQLTFTGTLETAGAVNGPWTAVPGNPASPLVIPKAQQTGTAFYRVR
ncbi:MAG: hypothetical protein U1G07_03160 [Verrucomicrobiota bacterium]